MRKYAIGYEGFFYVDADSEYDAAASASDILSTALPYRFYEGDWEIVTIELDNDNVFA